MSEQEPSKEISVLVVEDEPSVADALRMILEDCGYRVFVTTTGRDGIELARRLRCRIAITDLRLPDMIGFDVLNAVCLDQPHSLGILITSYGTPEVRNVAASCGALGILWKPFVPSDIVNLVTRLLAEHDGHDVVNR